eukprot:COSAG02_NODE_1085_length_14692_cov_4.244775_10_plen_421_part_00
MPLDLDEIFSYRTVRLAEIRDYRIGIPYYIIVVIICIDIFVVDLIINGGYLARETAITGSVRLTIQEPTGLYRKSTLDLPYCLDDCFPPDDCSGDYEQAQIQCPAIFSNAAFAKYPALEGQGAAFITTRVDSITEELPRHCLPTASDASQSATNSLKASTRRDCYGWQQVANRSFYVSQIEDYLIKVDHAMLAPTIRETKSGYDMTSGAMLSPDEEGLSSDDPDAIDPCWDFEHAQYWKGVPQDRRPNPLPPCPTADQFDGESTDISGDWSVAIGANGADDVFSVSALLRAAGVKSLSDPAVGHFAHSHQVRHAGIVLLLRIHYDNTWCVPLPRSRRLALSAYHLSCVAQGDQMVDLSGHHEISVRRMIANTELIYLSHSNNLIIADKIPGLSSSGWRPQLPLPGSKCSRQWVRSLRACR